MWRIQWSVTAPDSTQSVSCPGDGNTPGLGVAHRRCLTSGVWGSVDALECESVAVNNIRIRVGHIQYKFITCNYWSIY